MTCASKSCMILPCSLWSNLAWKALQTSESLMAVEQAALASWMVLAQVILASLTIAKQMALVSRNTQEHAALAPRATCEQMVLASLMVVKHKA